MKPCRRKREACAFPEGELLLCALLWSGWLPWLGAEAAALAGR